VSFAGEDKTSLVQIEKSDKTVKMIIDEKRIYFIGDLENARALDFRPDNVSIKGLILAIVSEAPNYRTY